MVLLRDMDQVVAISVYLNTVLILTQDGYAVCAKRAIGSEIILGTADGTPWLNVLSESLFWSIWR
jgi:hypothetical protein